VHRSTSTRGRAVLALTAVVAVLLAACSSSTASRSDLADAPTVSDASPSAAPDADEPGDDASADPDGAVAPGDTDGAADTPAGAGTVTDGGASGSSGADGSSDGGATDGGGPTSSTSTTSGGGATSTGQPPAQDLPPIDLGFAFGGGNSGAAFGVDVSTDEERARRWLQAFEDEYNERGGIAGRPVNSHPVFVNQDDQAESTQTRLQTQACVHFTEDIGVLMVLGDMTRYAHDCYVEHETAVFTPIQTVDSEQLRPLQPWILPSYFMVFDRLARLMPVSLGEQGFLTPGEKVGILAFDTPSYHRSIDTHMIPEIQRTGAEVFETVYMKIAYDDIAAQLAGAVLRWKANDVQRVIVFANGGGVWLLFAQNAESQSYRPWYGVSTMDRPFFTADLIHPAQLENVHGTGFWLTLDIDESEHPPLEPVEQECFRVVNERAGEDMNQRDLDGIGVLALCDLFRQVAHAFAPATGQPITRADVPRLYQRMGAGYDSVVMGPVDFSAGRWDAATRHRDLTYDTGCSCVKYTSPWRAIPF